MDSLTYNSSIEEKEEELELELKAELRTTEYPQCGKLGGAAVLQVSKLEYPKLLIFWQKSFMVIRFMLNFPYFELKLIFLHAFK